MSTQHNSTQRHPPPDSTGSGNPGPDGAASVDLAITAAGRRSSPEITRWAELVVRLLAESPYLRKHRPRVYIVVNPAAGGFARRKRFAAHLTGLEHAVERYAACDPAPQPDWLLLESRYAGHATEIGKAVVREVERNRSRAVLITAGGDGTHSECIGPLLDLSGKPLKHLAVFRLPMGSGNDGADADSMAHACSMLPRLSKIRHTAAVRVTPRNAESSYSLNITSIGIDAFVTHTTNKLRKRLPGDTYKAVADFATLFYEPIYKVGNMSAVLRSRRRKEPVTLTGNFILFAIGASGHRYYGDHKRILPSDDNVCAIRTVSLLRKLALKKLIYKGEHIYQSNVEMASAESVEIRYDRVAPLQVDGEGRWLTPDDFPVMFERTEPVLQVLKLPE